MEGEGERDLMGEISFQYEIPLRLLCEEEETPSEEENNCLLVLGGG